MKRDKQDGTWEGVATQGEPSGNLALTQKMKHALMKDHGFTDRQYKGLIFSSKKNLTISVLISFLILF